jgi:hypothetical protein
VGDDVDVEGRREGGKEDGGKEGRKFSSLFNGEVRMGNGFTYSSFSHSIIYLFPSFHPFPFIPNHWFT